jgi:uncharacterized protein YndB with AHSA1/START domain
LTETATATRSITAELDYAYPIDTVWKALTDSEWLAVWFFPNDIQPLQGHKFTIWGRPIERWDGEFQCEVLAVQPPRMIKFRWYGGHEELKAFGHYMDTVVTWTLSENADGGTHFHFFHEGIGGDTASDGLYDVMVNGSKKVMASLARRIPDLIQHGG